MAEKMADKKIERLRRAVVANPGDKWLELKLARELDHFSLFLLNSAQREMSRSFYI